MKILVLNGPNLNLLGARDKNQYGSTTLDDIQKMIIDEFPSHDFDFFQSNTEGELIDRIQSSSMNYEGLIINPGGYSHTSVAIRDALEICKLPKVEVHLSNLSSREKFRQELVTASACSGYVSGFKELGYFAAIYLIEKLQTGQ